METIFNKAELFTQEFEENAIVDVLSKNKMQIKIRTNNLTVKEIKKFFYSYRKQFKFIKPTLSVKNDTTVVITF